MRSMNTKHISPFFKIQIATLVPDFRFPGKFLIWYLFSWIFRLILLAPAITIMYITAIKVPRSTKYAPSTIFTSLIFSYTNCFSSQLPWSNYQDNRGAIVWETSTCCLCLVQHDPYNYKLLCCFLSQAEQQAVLSSKWNYGLLPVTH